MASRVLEGPMLGIKTFKCEPNNWLAAALSSTSKTLSVTAAGKTPYMPRVTGDNSCWEVMNLEESMCLLDYPDASFDVVYLINVLEFYSQDERKELVQEASRVTKNGGMVVAYSPACDDAEEVYDLLHKYGVDLNGFLNNRLTNKEIAGLRPSNAAFFQTVTVARDRARLVKILQEMGIGATLEHMWEVRDRFPIRRFHVGMSWLINRK